ncbi:UNVERIFIED_CONTAM: 6-phosphofructo-2-kinase/fructose-2,6-bisphosphatase, partial [Sesamum radiatum]
MGTGASRNPDSSSHGSEEREDQAGGQLYVSLKMENCKLKEELAPHVYGSVPSLAPGILPKHSRWNEIDVYVGIKFLLYLLITTLDFKFLLKPKYSNGPCLVEEGPNRQLTGGTLQGDRTSAMFKLSDDAVLEYRVFIKADRVSPFDLAASWRAYQENFQPSSVRGIPDVSINSAAEASNENGSSASLELDLEHYVVPAPTTSANSGLVYAANMTETPRSLSRRGVFSRTDGSSGALHYQRDTGVSVDRPDLTPMEVTVPDAAKISSGSGLVESKSVGTFSPVPKQEGHRGLFVDRGVGSPRLVKSASATTFIVDLKLDSESKNSMPAAAGAVAAAAVADQMLGPKEDRHLAIVLVGLPARGKTFTAAKLTRYLRWLGHDTKHFNVGKVITGVLLFLWSPYEVVYKRKLHYCVFLLQYRRLKHGVNQSADFFRGDNPEGLEARNEVAALAMEDMISWMQEGGQVGIFDATNSTRKRRNMLMKMAEGKCK